MIILDTNVLSEVQRPAPDHRVIAWLDRQPLDHLAISWVTVTELLLGVRILPEGARRRGLTRAVTEQLSLFEGRVLPFDADAAVLLADLTARRRALGRPLALADGHIAATARMHGAGVATRNTLDFDDLGLDLIDPWIPDSA